VAGIAQQRIRKLDNLVALNSIFSQSSLRGIIYLFHQCRDPRIIYIDTFHFL